MKRPSRGERGKLSRAGARASERARVRASVRTTIRSGARKALRHGSGLKVLNSVVAEKVFRIVLVGGD